MRAFASLLGLALASSLSAAHGQVQGPPFSDALVVSGTKIVPSSGRLYFGSTERPYEYDPNVSSASGRGLVRALNVVSKDWLAFERTSGAAYLPIAGGTRDGKECFRGLRRYQPNVDEVWFATKACLLPDEFPAVLAGADNFYVAGGRLFYTRHGVLRSSDGSATGNRQERDLAFGHSPFSQIDGRVVFAGGRAIDDQHFYEISAGGTVRSLGATEARVEGRIVQLGSGLYAVATTATYGKELYRHDLTSGRTSVVADLTPGPPGSDPGGLTLFNGALYVHANGPAGNELYRASEQGMTLVRDIHPTGSGTPRELTVGADRLYFRADDGKLGEELWQTDGTEAGTRLVEDLYEGKRGSRPNGLTFLGDALYVWANEGLWGESLWRLRAGAFEMIAATALTEPVWFNGNLDDWPARYDERTIHDPAGDVDVGASIDLLSAKVAADRSTVIVGYQVVSPLGASELTRHHVFFDVDRKDSTGWPVAVPGVRPFGGDYMLEGIFFYRYKGDGRSWDWEQMGYWQSATSSAGVEVSLGPRAISAGVIGSRVVLMGANLSRPDYAFFETP